MLRWSSYLCTALYSTVLDVGATFWGLQNQGGTHPYDGRLGGGLNDMETRFDSDGVDKGAFADTTLRR